MKRTAKASQEVIERVREFFKEGRSSGMPQIQKYLLRQGLNRGRDAIRRALRDLALQGEIVQVSSRPGFWTSKARLQEAEKVAEAAGLVSGFEPESRPPVTIDRLLEPIFPAPQIDWQVPVGSKLERLVDLQNQIRRCQKEADEIRTWLRSEDPRASALRDLILETITDPATAIKPGPTNTVTAATNTTPVNGNGWYAFSAPQEK